MSAHHDRHYPDRSVPLDALRGTAILLVVFGHAIQYSSRAPDDQEGLIFRLIYSFHMPLFFLLSGYLFRAPLLSKELLSKVGTRVLSLSVPFLVWTLLWQTCGDLTQGRFAGSMTWRTIWFLPVLAMCFLIHTIVILASGRGRTARRLPLGLVLTGLLYCIPYDIIWLNATRYHYLFFLGGAVARDQAKLKLFESTRSTIVCLSLWLVLGLIWLSISSNEFSAIVGNGLAARPVRLLIRGGIALLGISGTYGLVGHLPESSQRRLGWIGLYTIQIYLVHIGFLELVYAHAVPYSLWFWSLCLLMVAGPIAVALLVARYPRVHLILFGRYPVPIEDARYYLVRNQAARDAVSLRR